MFECETCDAVFYNWYACENHMDDCDHWPTCETCDREFRTEAACQQHMDAKDHWAPVYGCETCERKFWTQAACDQHMDSKGHWDVAYECETCDKEFSSVKAVNQHMRDTLHFSTYCPTCDRHFQNANALKMHLNSRIHRGQTVTCPFCQTRYTSASGLSHHLETGSCSRAPSLNREKIYELVHASDPKGLITKRQIEGFQIRNPEYHATAQAFNGSAWECYICHREFRTLKSLDQHLNSPLHKQNLYHCPNLKCGKEFVSLAALFNHLESESCGYMRFEKVNKRVGDVVRGRPFIEF